jgi:hypothetical protein
VDLPLDETIIPQSAPDATASNDQSAVEIKLRYQPIDFLYIRLVKSIGVGKDSIAKFHDKNRLQDAAAIAICQSARRSQRRVK